MRTNEIRGRIIRVDHQDSTSTVALSGGRGGVQQVQIARRDDLAAGHWLRLGAGEVLDVVASPSTRPFPPLDSDWYRFHKGDALRIRAVRARAQLNRTIRRLFEQRDFVEVETPGLARSPGLEVHLEAIRAEVRPGFESPPEQRYLVTSPEYHMKRLLTVGFERIYQLARAWRSGESGPWHNPEFTMLEWYRAWEGWRALLDDTEALLLQGADAVAPFRAAGHSPRQTRLERRHWIEIPFADAIEQWAGFAAYPWDDPELLWQRAKEAGLGVDERDRAESAAIFNRAIVERVEPRLPRDQVVVLYDFPDCMASLARSRPDAPHLAERFEVYVGGVELANGFGELTDPREQVRRFEADLAERARLGLALYPVDHRFVASLELGCPPAAGVALGVDRLLMFLLNATDIRDVVAFPESHT